MATSTGHVRFIPETSHYVETEERPCPVCGSRNYSAVFSDLNRREGLAVVSTVVDCRDCGMRYLNPVPTSERLVRWYREGLIDPVRPEGDILPVSCGGLTDTAGGSSMFRTINGLLRGRPHDWPEEEGRGRCILDFGCHDGEKLTRWYRSGWKVAGVDLNEPAISAAKKRLPEGRFWCGDLPDMEIRDQFDAIRSDNVVEHLRDPVSYLAALVKLLKPGGSLRVFVPNGNGLSAVLLGRYSYVYWLPFHLNFFTPKTLRVAMKRAGLLHPECLVYSPVGSWAHSQRQLLLPPGFDRRPSSLLDRAIRRLWLFNYPGETVAQWLGLGEEVVGTGSVPA